ncbi:hypothetical protein, partial [Vibrio fluvialis]|uniref:hypothetical protein n=1 Tax=Vibrio fluvialis TaxID=676 RepID=UPI000A7EA864
MDDKSTKNQILPTVETSSATLQKPTPNSVVDERPEENQLSQLSNKTLPSRQGKLVTDSTQALNFHIEVESKPQVTASFLGFKTNDITPLVTLATAFFVAYRYFSDKKDARTNAEIIKLEERVRTLYGPLKELREESKKLYGIFAVEIKDEYKSSGKQRFRTMTYLRENPPKSELLSNV